MENLPLETLTIIFENLHISAKQECLLVCHQWENALRSTCLYDSVVISKIGVFNRFVRILEEKEHVRDQVKELVLRGNIYIRMHATQFDRLFFNLRSIHFGAGIFIRALGYAQNRSVSLKHWGDQIQIVKLHNDSEFMYSLLTASICPNLTTLSIAGSYFGMGSTRLLAAAPNLQNLTVANILAPTSLIEEVHAAVPALHSLELIEVVLEGDIDIDQINIADSMEAVHIHFTNADTEDVLGWLQYIAVKYTNIATLSFVCGGDPTKWLDDGSAGTALQKLCHLRHFKTRLPPSIATLFNVIEIHNSNIEELSLIANYDDTCRPIMTDSSHYRLITELSLNMDSTTWLWVLQYMKYIKTLDIHIVALRSKLDLNELMNLCPEKIDSITIKGCKVICRNREYQQHQLGKLGIDS